jgi:hypothetical protein
MKTIEYLKQKELEKVITDHVKTAGIYCFGKRETIENSSTTLYPDKRIKNKHIHLYLLVLVQETIENVTNDICDKIEVKTQGYITATLLIHQVNNLKKMYGDQQHFFWSIMQKAELLFQDEDKPPYLITNGTPKRNLKSALLYVANRKNNISTIWSWVYNDDDVNSSDEVKISGLHQIVEQTCLSLICVFLGYSPNHFSLDHLFNLCGYFTTITTDFFPRKTQEDKSMFKLLKKTPCALRFSKANDVDYLYYQLLEQRCCKFKNQADILIQIELN